MNEQSNPTLRSVSNALEILHLLRARGPMRITEIAAQMRIGLSTAHRLVATLREQRFVRQEPDGKRYELGSAMLFSTEVSALQHCVSVSARVMERLRGRSNETVHLSVLRGDRCLFAASVESEQMVRVSSRVGQGPYAHTAAGGKILLAALSHERLLELLPNEQLPTPTDHSIALRSELLTELDQAKTLGYARNISESEAGMFAIAVPIRRPEGEVISSLTIAAPLSRVEGTGSGKLSNSLTPYEHELVTALKEAAAEIESLLAF
ncbi:IclR family transcriptional regulator [Alpinimonas psychrophila]|uniref:DNA-binding IclR family transcriptional regulator n=1 Tax=Alpinimonas psychrophila TaxID=748908 RepID=A0A7W3PP82_9MICO|nr:IclR family transcriptional regulator [Alpinimonas psychrophila]MBA8829654.1 DNA-binding IclR family transcriptional regulator [Alpinimonas psychrophila]